MTACTTCADKYYRASPTVCTLGNIPDCLAYTGSTGAACSRCVDGKMPIAAPAAGTNPVTPAVV